MYRTGRRRASRQFTVFVAPNGRTESRMGMSVARALGGAVARNRIRRRVREILRLHWREIPSGWDIVVHPRASVAGAEFGVLRAELMGLLGNLPAAPAVPSKGEPAREEKKPGGPGSGPAIRGS